MKLNWSVILRVCAVVLAVLLKLSTSQEDETQP